MWWTMYLVSIQGVQCGEVVRSRARRVCAPRDRLWGDGPGVMWLHENPGRGFDLRQIQG